MVKPLVEKANKKPIEIFAEKFENKRRNGKTEWQGHFFVEFFLWHEA